MKIVITSILLSLACSQYLQDGLYPECSYVVVTEDGWRVYKNHEGRVLSMMPKEKHNDKPGKYSFDKFGNLIPFTDCKSSQIMKNKLNKDNPEIDINFKFSIKNLLKFSIYGGTLLPYGKDIDMFGLGPYGGLDIKLENYAISVIGSMNENKTIQNGIDINETLTSIGIYTGYIINLGNIYVKPSVGVLNRTKKNRRK